MSIINLHYVHDVQDHYFDVVTNVVGLVAAVLGDKFYWWIDPAGAIILAIYTVINWSATVWENAGSISNLIFISTMTICDFHEPFLYMRNMYKPDTCICFFFLSHIFLQMLIWLLTFITASLVGQSASPEMLQKLTYLVTRHDRRIKHVDTVRAYTFGSLYFVEVGISIFSLALNEDL